MFDGGFVLLPPASAGATATPTVTASPTASATTSPTTTATPTAVRHIQYLSFVTTSRPTLITTFSPSGVPTSPVSTPGQIFFTTTITLPAPIPSGGTYWLSASPTSLVPGLVDDAVVVRAGATEVFRYDYGANGPPQAALVAVPASALTPWAGQALTVLFQDLHGSVISATPLYLVWRR